ncbi:hypothetical protein F5X68DRAFT_265809 [Plectosphaerella plurivora]|uniref:Zn(2)-C6 fungal-type domain-containing protein n=1 Tax=Plectosphaerella plurivora TaxID=936078 RepID=A0A9P9A6D3_9PEZI|nr:hypothetical protein F5X68DRAFT_265809 [Plectosphaerella plurivora]
MAPRPSSSESRSSSVRVPGLDSTSGRRSDNVCWQCRQRKVGCDGRRASCGNCERLGFSCSYSYLTSSTTTTSESLCAPSLHVPRRRGQQACTACRRRKIRCDGHLPGCGRCSRMGLGCVYNSLRRRLPDVDSVQDVGPHPEHPIINDSESDNLLTDHAITTLLRSPLGQLSLDVFFQRVAPIPVFSFLHRATVMEQNLGGTLHPALHLALFGIAILFADPDSELGSSGSASSRGAKAVDAAERMVVADGLETPSVVKLQALTLVIQHRAMSRRFSKAFMLAALAVRAAMALRLNYELAPSAAVPFLARESCRRLVWSLYMTDTTLAAGYDCFTLMRPEVIAIQLPCDDHCFMMDIPQETMPLLPMTGTTPSESTAAPPPELPQLSLLALTVRVLWLRQRVLQFTKEAVAASSAGPVQVQAATLEADLAAFQESLPTQLRLSQYAISLHAHLPTLAAYLKVHVTYLATRCILYRLALDGLKEALPLRARSLFAPDLLAQWQDRCVQSARAMARLFKSTLHIQTGTETVRLDVDLAVVVYQCARILAYASVTDTQSGAPPEEIEPHLVTCQKFMDRMFADCAAVADIKADLSDLIDAINGPPRDDAHRGKIASCVDLQHGQDDQLSSPGHRHILSKHSMIGRMDATGNLLKGSFKDLRHPFAGGHDHAVDDEENADNNTQNEVQGCPSYFPTSGATGITSPFPRPVLPTAFTQQSDAGPLDVDEMFSVQDLDIWGFYTFDPVDLGLSPPQSH